MGDLMGGNEIDKVYFNERTGNLTNEEINNLYQCSWANVKDPFELIMGITGVRGWRVTNQDGRCFDLVIYLSKDYMPNSSEIIGKVNKILHEQLTAFWKCLSVQAKEAE